MLFQEAAGLDTEVQPIEYRHGDNPKFSSVKMPGIQTLGIVTMKRGVFESDNQGWASFNEIAMNTIKRVPVTISLLDEQGSAMMVWTLVNAWAAKITSTDLKADGN
jgi:phage tail-like protein